MCKYCEYHIKDGEENVMPLPTPESHPDSAQIGVFERSLVAVMYPPVVAGPINYCPMCGRKLGIDVTLPVRIHDVPQCPICHGDGFFRIHPADEQGMVTLRCASCGTDYRYKRPERGGDAS